MIFSTIQAKKELRCYPEAIQRAVDYVLNTDFSKMEDGRHPIDGDRMFANLFHLTSKPKDEIHPEAHKKYIDVQFWLDGEELCGNAPFVEGVPCVDAREDEDLYFYEDFPEESFVRAKPGCFAVFFPNDAHRPGVCTENGPSTYRKVVVKVSTGLLGAQV